MPEYPKRLIEVDLPIKRISAHARREKSIRRGHISTLHLWWARRPLAACRAVLCASLWPDPADELCPAIFRERARELMVDWARDRMPRVKGTMSKESIEKFLAVRSDPILLANAAELRGALLDFIADFSNWDNATNSDFLETSRRLTIASHEALGGEEGTRPLVVDPFAGGGAIPVEALRVGADAFGSDLNPVAVLLNKVLLEYLPKYGRTLAHELRKWGAWIVEEAHRELGRFYPADPDGAIPVAYLWARTIQCEGPSCGADVPLIRSLWLSKKTNRSVAVQLVADPEAKRVKFKIVNKLRGCWVNQDNPNDKIANPSFEGTVKRGAVTCPCCGYTTAVTRVREQLKKRRGGSRDAQMFAVAITRPGEQGRLYRLPTERDSSAASSASIALRERECRYAETLSLIPNEKLDVRGIRHTWAMIYGLEHWDDYFTERQLLALTTLASLATRASPTEGSELRDERIAVQTLLGLAISRWSDICNSLCRWEATKTQVRNLFGRQAIPMIWDFAEPNIFADAAGNYSVTLATMAEVIERQAAIGNSGTTLQASAALHPLPADSADAVFTDPPYYDAVPYAYLADFFYVWLRRSLGKLHPELFKDSSTPKDQEIVVDRPHELSDSTHDVAFYERELTKAFAEARRIAKPESLGVIVFASKTTASWEAILQAVIDAGWVIVASWPIDTELENRVSAQGQARLGSSVHLVCRPREDNEGHVRDDDTGDWRDVLHELPKRIHDWMPRLAEEGIVGADAIFACLGPALEIFSRYSRVEKANGETVTLRDYLEYVWAAVAKEALAMVFQGADATGFEADARLTAMWLWTLKGGEPGGDGDTVEGDSDSDSEEDGTATSGGKSGFALEFDAARKIAQGLGAHLESLSHLVEVTGETARLLAVAERTKHLFGKDEAETTISAPKKKKSAQLDMFTELTEGANTETTWNEKTVLRVGDTTLDRVHQSMILFAAGRGEALKRFVIDDGVGRDARFWRLAQALSALYPTGAEEKRWVDGVLARKKSFGF